MSSKRPTSEGPTEQLPALSDEQPLARWRAAHGKLTTHEAVDLLLAICSALVDLHASNPTTGALDLNQIFISASALRRSVRIDGTRLGKVSPALARATDVHALGMLCFTLCVGRSPNRGESLGDVLPDAPEALDRLSRQMVDPDPAARPALAEVRDQLAALLEAAAKEVRKSLLLTSLPKLKRRPGSGPIEPVRGRWTVMLTDEATRGVSPGLGDDDEPTAAMPVAPPSELPTVAGTPARQHLRPEPGFSPSTDDVPTRAPPSKRRGRSKS